MTTFQVRPTAGFSQYQRKPNPVMSWELLTTPQYPEVVGQFPRHERELSGFEPDHWYRALVKKPGEEAMSFEGRLLGQYNPLREVADHRARTSSTYKDEYAELGLIVVTPTNPTTKGRANTFGADVHFEFMNCKDGGVGRLTTHQHYQLISHTPMKSFGFLAGIGSIDVLAEKINGPYEDRIRALQEGVIASRSCRRTRADELITFDSSQLHQTYPHMEESRPRSFLQIVFGLVPPPSSKIECPLGEFGRIESHRLSAAYLIRQRAERRLG